MKENTYWTFACPSEDNCGSYLLGYITPDIEAIPIFKSKTLAELEASKMQGDVKVMEIKVTIV